MEAVIDPKYSIGIAAMDAQHARLLQIMNDFRSIGEEHLLSPEGVVAAIKALEQMLKYTQSHFASEEAFMATHGYPYLAAHQEQHRALAAVVVKLLDEARIHASTGSPLKLNLFTTVWLLEHIMGEDDKYARFVLGKPAVSVAR